MGNKVGLYSEYINIFVMKYYFFNIMLLIKKGPGYV